jgi:hypothetical protein
MGNPARDMHYRHAAGNSAQPHDRSKERAMWQVHAAIRLGDYRTPEFDITPAIGLTLIVAVVALIIRTGL